MKTILVPTDLSITADYAIKYAVSLANYFDASIILYNAFIPFESRFYPIEQSKKENLQQENILIKRLSKIKESILETNETLSVSVHVDKGPESIRLIEYSLENKIDLIIMGTTGASGLKEVIIGSFTSEIMIKAPCPVLAIPKKYKFKIPKKINYATVLHSNDSFAIKFLIEFNNEFNGEIKIIHIDDDEQISAAEEIEFAKYREKIEIEFGSIPIQFQHIPAKDVLKALLDISLKDNTDIMAISPSKREGFWDRLRKKSLTKTIAYQIPIPLLSIPVNKQ
jgi:nucleotide-binding universal stress UspA family protein